MFDRFSSLRGFREPCHKIIFFEVLRNSLRFIENNRLPQLTNHKPVFRWIFHSVAQGVIQNNQSRVGTRLQYKKQHLVRSIFVINHCRCQYWWAPYKNPPIVTPDSLRLTTGRLGLNTEPTKLACRSDIHIRNKALPRVSPVFNTPTG